MINQFSREFALFFEKLRNSRNLTQEQFTQGIVSIRQYRRYIRGECLIPQYVVNDLSKRLGFNPEHIITEFDSERIKESRLVSALYNAVVNQDFYRVKQYIKTINYKQLLDEQNRMLYNHAIRIYKHLNGKLSDEDITKLTLEAVDYNYLMKQSIFSPVELLLLTSLFSHDSFTEKAKLAEKLNSFLSEIELITTSQNDNMMLLVMFQLAKHYGTNKEYKKVNLLCNKAIEYNLTQKNYYLLEYFYFFNALAYRELEDDYRVKDYLFRCFCILYADNNRTKIKKFTKYIEKDFHMDFKKFAIRHIPNLP